MDHRLATIEGFLLFVYPHHIGDFIKETARLSDAQCMAYLRLLWVYYDTEAPIENNPEDIAFDIGSDPDTVRQIFRHFFVLDANGMQTHKRVEREIAAYRKKADKARESANARWSNAIALQSQSERNAKASKNNANREPITDTDPKGSDLNTTPPSEKPPKSDNPPMTISDLVTAGASEAIAVEYLAHRKRKKAPLSHRAWRDIAKEIAMAGWSIDDALKRAIDKGWTGFEAAWVQKNTKLNGDRHGNFQRLDHKAGATDPATIDWLKDNADKLP